MKKFTHIILLVLTLQACGSYKQNIMFQQDDQATISQVTAAEKASKNYIIQQNDQLKLEVYTKKGEFLIDPENKLIDQRVPNNSSYKPDLMYLVRNDGTVALPLVGLTKLGGLTLTEAEMKLSEAYATYYKDPFVKLQYINKRVFVLGATGGNVIPIANESTTVIEVLALVEGFEKEAKSHNIRLLRGDEAYLLDFSTITGFQQNNMIVQSGDVIYIEPVRRPFSEFIQDNGPVISVFSSLASLIAVIISLN